jgi:hypothetical protein
MQLKHMVSSKAVPFSEHKKIVGNSKMV